MCIRDRGVAVPWLLHFVSREMGAQTGPGSGMAVAALCLAAVSYTHLRAHETVLDLVCRLLLEKKKL